MKSTHIRVYDFLRCMGEVTKDSSTFTLAEQNIVTSSIFKAIEKGHVEFVIHLCRANPTLVAWTPWMKKNGTYFNMPLNVVKKEFIILYMGSRKKRELRSECKI